MKKRILSIVMALIMAMAVLPVVSFAAIDLPRPVGTDLSAMNTTDLDGNRYTADMFSQYQLTVLNVWATWCGPCVNEMPHFQKFHEEYEERGIKMVGLLFEDNMSTLNGGKSMLENKGYTYLNLRFDTTLAAMYNNSFEGSGSIPDTYLVDSKGVVISAKNAAFNSYEELVNWVMAYYTEPVLNSITMAESAEIGTNRMTLLTPEFEPTYANRTEVVWSTSDEQVATIADNGLVTGHKAGTAVITASVESYGEKYEAKCVVTVKESEPLTEGTEYFRQTTELVPGKTYAIVVKYNDFYYAMSNVEAVNGKCRLVGARVAPEDILIVSNKSEGDRMDFLHMDDSNLWMFSGDNENGYTISSLNNGWYLGSQRVNGTYRLRLVSKADVKWVYEDGLLMNATSGKYTSSRRYITYFMDDENRYDAAFDMLDKENELFTEVLYYERVVEGAVPPEETVGDLNGNGMVDAGDATMVLRHVVGTELLSDELLEAADLNGNGRVDSGDAGLILRKAL